MPKQFKRRTWNRYSKLGKRRKKKQIWRRPTGRDNKMREKRKGYPAVVSLGYRTNNKERKEIVKIYNLKDFEKVQKNDIAVFGNIGKRKKIELAKKAKEMKIEISNLNVEKFLKKIKEKEEKKKKVEAEKKAEEKKKKSAKSQSDLGDKKDNKEKSEASESKSDDKDKSSEEEGK